MRKKKEMSRSRENRRMTFLLIVGLPTLLLIYGYFYYRDQGKLEGTVWVEAPDQFVDRCIEWGKEKWDEVAGRYFTDEIIAQDPDDELFAPGSAGQLGKAPRMYGMEVPLEEHRKLVLKATEGGTLSIPEDEEGEVQE
jgi:hypothetical protein